MGNFKTIYDFHAEIDLAAGYWEQEAYHLHHGNTDLLQGPNHAMSWQSAEWYAKELRQLSKAIDDIIGPPPTKGN